MVRFTVEPDEPPLTLTPRRLLIAGYTGRDQAAVTRHVAELREHGIPAPVRVPALYALTPDRVTTAERITVVGQQTSGEAELVLILADDQLYVGVGSDHTDRDLESLAVTRAKQVCPKPLGGYVWPREQVQDPWDHCLLRSWSSGTLYQAGSVAELMRPDAVLTMAQQRVGDLDDVIIYCGTLPLMAGALRFDRTFRATLASPMQSRELSCEYSVDVVDDLD